MPLEAGIKRKKMKKYCLFEYSCYICRVLSAFSDRIVMPVRVDRMSLIR